MSQKKIDGLQHHLNELETQRIMSLSLREISNVLEVLQKSDCSLTIKEIAQKIGKSETPRFTAFVEALVLCGYLARQNTSSEITFSIKRHEPGTLPEPIVPLPLERFEFWVDKKGPN